MEILEQLSIFLANRPGVLARVTHALAEEGINLKAMSVSDTVDHAVVRMVPDDPRKARDVLERGGALVVETEVLCVELADHPGALAELSDKLARADVNIEYAYGSASSGGVSLIVRVSDVAAARGALA